MIGRVSLFLLLIAAFDARADWTLSFRKTLAEFPGGAAFVEREAIENGAAVRIQGVFFREKDCRFVVIDNAARGTLDSAMLAAGAIAGVNGGYFHDNLTPVGLEIADGKPIHCFERAKLLSGVFVVRGGEPRLIRSSAYEPSKKDTDALQAGPFLVSGGQAAAGLNGERHARRTVLATDGNGRWAVLLFSRVTLSDAGAILASRAIFEDFRIERALNLDGGSSSALWVATESKPFYLRESGAVRNFLGILPK